MLVLLEIIGRGMLEEHNLSICSFDVITLTEVLRWMGLAWNVKAEKLETMNSHGH
jgi:hypothetical protein